ncbi:hypothetical protein L218DRAFT_994979 [Marasmius fiardii PR-910]|nr:hypothetical protein L218DRAFT_994979 [Marasmius fiardii PR-910]
MPNPTPVNILESFKKSGEYDRVRRELLTQFQKSEGIESFKSKIEENIRQLLVTDARLRFDVMSGTFNQDTQKLLVEQVERFPTVERAVSDHVMFSDPTLLANIRGFIDGVLSENKDKQKGMGVTATSSNGNANTAEHVQNKLDASPEVNHPLSPKDPGVVDSGPARPTIDADTHEKPQNDNLHSNSTSESPGGPPHPSDPERSQSDSQTESALPPFEQPVVSEAKIDSEMEDATATQFIDKRTDQDQDVVMQDKNDQDK